MKFELPDAIEVACPWTAWRQLPPGRGSTRRATRRAERVDAEDA